MITETTVRYRNSLERERESFQETLDAALGQALRVKYPKLVRLTLEAVAPLTLVEEDPEKEDPHEWVRFVATGIASQWREMDGEEVYEKTTQSSFGVKEKTGRVFVSSKFKPLFAPSYEVILDGVSDAAVRWTQQVVEARELNQEQALNYQSVMTELAVRIAGGIVAEDGIQRQGTSAGYLIKRKILERSPFTRERFDNNRIANPSVRPY